MALIFDFNTLRELFGTKLTQISTLPIDVTVSERHRLATTVTRKPVEDGSTIHTNAINESAQVTIDGIMTDDLLAESWEDKWKALKEIRAAREPFTVVTALDVYENCIFESIDINRDSSTGDALFFSAALVDARIIESQTVGVPTKATGTPAQQAPKQDAGKKQPQDQTEEQSQSWIKAGASLF